MKTGWTGGAAGLLMAWMIATTGAAPVAAQADRDECRCVDRDGNPIEQCTCFRMPAIGRIMADAAVMGRPRLGVSVDPTQSATRDTLGAWVTDVLEGGPADDAGIRDGDAITSVDGHSLLEPLPQEDEKGFDTDRSMPVQRLLAIARDLNAGQQVEVVFRRGDETRTVMVKAEDLPVWGNGVSVFTPGFDADALGARMRAMGDRLRTFQMDSLPARMRNGALGFRYFAPDASGTAPMLFLRGGGVELVELSPQLGAYFGVDHGVLVLEVDDDSTLGLEPGDVVLEVGDRAVDTPDRLRRILATYGPDEDIALHVRRKGKEMSVSGHLTR